MITIAAHLGHLSEAAGHEHWIAAAAIALAGAAAVYGWFTEPRADDEAPKDGEPRS